jgi:hypothetical protein
VNTIIEYRPRRHGKITDQLDTIAGDIRWRLASIGEHVIAIGQLLSAARMTADYGQWSVWLADLGISETTARNWMNVARNFELATAEAYQRAALYALAAPSVTDEVREAAEQIVASRDAQITLREAKLLKVAPDGVRNQFASGKLSLEAAEGLVESLKQPVKPQVRQMVERGQITDPAVVPMLDQLDDDTLEVAEASGTVDGETPLVQLRAADLVRYEDEQRREKQRQQRATTRVTVCMNHKADVVAVDGDRVTLDVSGLGDRLPAGVVVYVTIERKIEK